MENENIKVENVDLDEEIVLDLDSEADFAKLYDNVKNIGNYFKPETDMTYRVILTNSKITPVERVFNEGTEKENKVIKYSLDVKAVNKNKSEFTGAWEVGSATLRKILDIIKESAKKSTETYFRLKKTGSGLSTDYDIMSDEF